MSESEGAGKYADSPRRRARAAAAAAAAAAELTPPDAWGDQGASSGRHGGGGYEPSGYSASGYEASGYQASGYQGGYDASYSSGHPSGGAPAPDYEQQHDPYAQQPYGGAAGTSTPSYQAPQPLASGYSSASDYASPSDFSASTGYSASDYSSTGYGARAYDDLSPARPSSEPQSYAAPSAEAYSSNGYSANAYPADPSGNGYSSNGYSVDPSSNGYSANGYSADPSSNGYSANGYSADPAQYSSPYGGGQSAGTYGGDVGGGPAAADRSPYEDVLGAPTVTATSAPTGTAPYPLPPAPAAPPSPMNGSSLGLPAAPAVPSPGSYGEFDPYRPAPGTYAPPSDPFAGPAASAGTDQATVGSAPPVPTWSATDYAAPPGTTLPAPAAPFDEPWPGSSAPPRRRSRADRGADHPDDLPTRRSDGGGSRRGRTGRPTDGPDDRSSTRTAQRSRARTGHDQGVPRSSGGGGLLTSLRRGRRGNERGDRFDPLLRERSASERSGPQTPLQAAAGAATEVVVVLAMALGLSLLIKTFLVQAFFIPSQSMQDTLLVGDRVLVSKLTPGPFDLHRGDVVVFKDPGGWLDAPPDQPQSPIRHALTVALTFVGLLPQDSGEHLIKRVIGLPGDTVACCDAKGRLTVNGTPVDEAYVRQGSKPSEQTFKVTVKAGHLWVMGDNRAQSYDSRFHRELDDGQVPSKNVVGKAFVVVWPFNRFGGVPDPPQVFARVPDPPSSGAT